jgi:hypothetical protein
LGSHGEQVWLSASLHNLFITPNPLWNASECEYHRRFFPGGKTVAHPNNAAETKKIRTYVKKAEAAVDKLDIVPRAVHRYPFDIIGLATLSKVFALSKACLKLLGSGYPDEAYGLARSIVECATNLRYLTADPAEQGKRTHDFVKFAMADKSFWYHHALESAKTDKEKDELRAYAKQVGIVADVKSARRHWSGIDGSFVWRVTQLDHALDGAMTLAHRIKAYAVDYYQTSAWVHCSSPAIDCYFADDGVPFRISASSGLHETQQSTLFIVLVYLHSAIGYVLEGINLERPAKLNLFFERTLKGMKPIPMRNSRKTKK